MSGNPAAQQLNSLTFYDYQFPFSTALTATFSTLEVSAVPATNTSNYVAIKKITIVETAPAQSQFNITPSTVAIACGSTVAQTFTVNNPSNITGVTGYTWNLGASNGWLYGGSAAPATFTTGTNSISLTPACGGTLKNVSATVSTTGSSYGPYTSTVSVAQTTYTINGDNSFCFTSNPYSVANLPCGSTVTWSAYPSSTVTLTPSGNTVTAKRNTYETFTLNATINNGCGTASKSVGGNKTSSYIPIYGPTSVSCDQTIRYHTFDIQGVSYQWSYPSSWSLISGQYTSSIGFQTPTYPYSTLSGYVTVSIHDVCSNVSSSVYVSSTCGSFVVSPNPATSTVTVSSPVTAAKERKGGRLITEVNLYDQSGNLKKRQKFSSVKTATLSLTNLKKGAYFIEIGDASSKERQQLIIQ